MLNIYRFGQNIFLVEVAGCDWSQSMIDSIEIRMLHRKDPYDQTPFEWFTYVGYVRDESENNKRKHCTNPTNKNNISGIEGNEIN